MCFASSPDAPPPPPPPPEPTATAAARPRGQRAAQRQASNQGLSQFRVPLPRINLPR